MPGAKFSTWLFTIAGNVASNALRTQGPAAGSAPGAAASDSAPQSLEAVALAASGLMPTRQLDKAELCAAVQQAIGALNDRQRMAVLLAKFEHFSYADIGEVMDMSPQAIKSLLVAGARATCARRCSRTWIAARRSNGVPSESDSRQPIILDTGRRT